MKREIALPPPTIQPIIIPGTMENQQNNMTSVMTPETNENQQYMTNVMTPGTIENQQYMAGSYQANQGLGGNQNQPQAFPQTSVNQTYPQF